MIITNYFKDKLVQTKIDKLRKLNAIHAKYKDNILHLKGILKIKVEIKDAELQKEKKQIFESSIERHMVGFVLNNPKLDKQAYLTLENKLTKQAEIRFETHKKAVERNFREENKAIIKRIDTFKNLEKNIVLLKEEINQLQANNTTLLTK